MATRQLQVERRTVKVRRSKTDVLPLCPVNVLYVHSWLMSHAAGYGKQQCVAKDERQLRRSNNKHT